MNEAQLIRKLQSVGKRAFVENYQLFESYAAGKISRESAIGTLVGSGVSNEAGAAIRVGNAKRIFDARKQRSALEMICDSRRISRSTFVQAESLLQVRSLVENGPYRLAISQIARYKRSGIDRAPRGRGEGLSETTAQAALSTGSRSHLVPSFGPSGALRATKFDHCAGMHRCRGAQGCAGTAPSNLSTPAVLRTTGVLLPSPPAIKKPPGGGIC
jgi:hypothetical protein